ncbi:MAG: hypothetical protein AAB262_10170, partial [Elusimicrobiota bacterium]
MSMSAAEKKHYVKYVVARLAPYANIAGWNYTWEMQDVGGYELAGLLAQYDPWEHLRTYHDDSLSSHDFADPRYTFAAVEEYNPDLSWPARSVGSYPGHRAMLMAYANKPVYMMEGSSLWYACYHEASGGYSNWDSSRAEDDARRTAWAITTAAGSFTWNDHPGCGNPARSSDVLAMTESVDYMNILHQIMEVDVTFYRMDPHDELLSGKSATEVWALAEIGKQYLVYAEAGANFKLSVAGGSYTATWINTQTNARQNANGGVVAGASAIPFTPPNGSDWVLLVRSVSTPDIAAPSVPSGLSAGWQAVPLVTAESRARGHSGGEGGQNTRSFAIDSTGNFMMMGNDVGGVYRSLDGGAHWEPATIGLPISGSPSIAIDPNNSDRVILVGAHNSNVSWLDTPGLYLSTDRGRTWSQRLQSGTDNWFDVNEIAWDPSSASGGMSKIAYWSSSSDYDTGLFKTTDGGLTWAKVNAGYGNGSVAVHATKGYVYIATSSGFFRSTNGGSSFTKILSENLRGVSAVSARPDLVAVSGTGGISVSNDAGLTFTKRPGTGLPTYGIGPYGIRISPANPNYMMIAYNGPPGYWWDQGMWYSHDGGNTWARPIVDGTDTFFDYIAPDDFNAKGRAWHPTNPNVLFITSDWILKSNDGGAHVFNSNDGYNGIMATSHWGLNPFNSDLLAFSASDWKGGFSFDGGYSWIDMSNLNASWGNGHGAYALSKSRLFYALGRDYDTKTLYTSSDGGKTWTAPGVTGGDDHVSGDPGNPNGAFWGNWRTADQGATWQRMSGADRVFTYNPAGTKELYGTRGAQYPAGTSNTVVKSVDHGVTWSAVFTAPNIIWDIAYDHIRNRIYVTLGDRGDTTPRFYQWQNGTLSDITDRLPADQEGARTIHTVAVDPVDPSVVYAGGGRWDYIMSAGVMRSLDAGATWKTLTLQPADTGIDGGRQPGTLRVHPLTRYLWVTTGCRGIWKYPPPGGTPSGDTSAPSVPSGLSASAVSSSQINLSWNASTDNVLVTGYRIFRGGSQIATTASTSYSNSGLAALTAYSYTVAAYDAAGNVSAQSAAASASTPATTPAPATLPSPWSFADVGAPQP